VSVKYGLRGFAPGPGPRKGKGFLGFSGQRILFREHVILDIFEKPIGGSLENPGEVDDVLDEEGEIRSMGVLASPRGLNLDGNPTLSGIVGVTVEIGTDDASHVVD
jgi:hypothetical protein